MSDEERLVVEIGDKKYDLNPPFTNRELHVIKTVAGVRAGEIFEALNAGDSDVLVALAHVAVIRNGTARPSLEELWDMEAGSIDIGEVTPDPTPAATETSTVEAGSPETPPSDSGSPSSDASTTSAPETSAS